MMLDKEDIEEHGNHETDFIQWFLSSYADIILISILR